MNDLTDISSCNVYDFLLDVKFTCEMLLLRVLVTVCLAFTVDAICTFPTTINGTYESSHNGVITFYNDSYLDYPVEGKGTLTFECYMTSGTKYIWKSDLFPVFNSYLLAVLCFDITTLKSGLHQMQIFTSKLQNADNQRVKFISTTTTITDSLACDDNANTETSIFMESGTISSLAIQCPDVLLGQFNYTFNETDCLSDPGQLDVCTDTTLMRYNYSICSTVQAYSENGSVNCLHSSTDGTTTTLYAYNLDTAPDESTYFRFTCFKIEYSGDVVYATQHPQDCRSTQTSTTVDGPGATLNLTASVTCVPTTSTTEAAVATSVASAGLIAGVVVALLLLIVIGLFIGYCVYVKKFKKDRVEPRKGLPPTSTGQDEETGETAQQSRNTIEVVPTEPEVQTAVQEREPMLVVSSVDETKDSQNANLEQQENLNSKSMNENVGLSMRREVSFADDIELISKQYPNGRIGSARPAPHFMRSAKRVSKTSHGQREVSISSDWQSYSHRILRQSIRSREMNLHDGYSSENEFRQEFEFDINIRVKGKVVSLENLPTDDRAATARSVVLKPILKRTASKRRPNRRARPDTEPPAILIIQPFDDLVYLTHDGNGEFANDFPEDDDDLYEGMQKLNVEETSLEGDRKEQHDEKVEEKEEAKTEGESAETVVQDIEHERHESVFVSGNVKIELPVTDKKANEKTDVPNIIPRIEGDTVFQNENEEPGIPIIPETAPKTTTTIRKETKSKESAEVLKEKTLVENIETPSMVVETPKDEIRNTGITELNASDNTHIRLRFEKNGLSETKNNDKENVNISYSEMNKNATLVTADTSQHLNEHVKTKETVGMKSRENTHSKLHLGSIQHQTHTEETKDVRYDNVERTSSVPDFDDIPHAVSLNIQIPPTKTLFHESKQRSEDDYTYHSANSMRAQDRTMYNIDQPSESLQSHPQRTELTGDNDQHKTTDKGEDHILAQKSDDRVHLEQDSYNNTISTVDISGENDGIKPVVRRERSSDILQENKSLNLPDAGLAAREEQEGKGESLNQNITVGLDEAKEQSGLSDKKETLPHSEASSNSVSHRILPNQDYIRERSKLKHGQNKGLNLSRESSTQDDKEQTPAVRDVDSSVMVGKVDNVNVPEETKKQDPNEIQKDLPVKEISGMMVTDVDVDEDLRNIDLADPNSIEHVKTEDNEAKRAASKQAATSTKDTTIKHKDKSESKKLNSKSEETITFSQFGMRAEVKRQQDDKPKQSEELRQKPNAKSAKVNSAYTRNVKEDIQVIPSSKETIDKSSQEITKPVDLLSGARLITPAMQRSESVAKAHQRSLELTQKRPASESTDVKGKHEQNSATKSNDVNEKQRESQKNAGKDDKKHKVKSDKSKSSTQKNTKTKSDKKKGSIKHKRKQKHYELHTKASVAKNKQATGETCSEIEASNFDKFGEAEKKLRRSKPNKFRLDDLSLRKSNKKKIKKLKKESYDILDLRDNTYVDATVKKKFIDLSSQYAISKENRAVANSDDTDQSDADSVWSVGSGVSIRSERLSSRLSRDRRRKYRRKRYRSTSCLSRAVSLDSGSDLSDEEDPLLRVQKRAGSSARPSGSGDIRGLIMKIKESSEMSSKSADSGSSVNLRKTPDGTESSEVDRNVNINDSETVTNDKHTDVTTVTTKL